MPAEFDHRALGSSLTISSDSYRFRDNEVLFQFSSPSNQIEIAECGVQILTTDDDDDDDDESILSAGSSKSSSEQVTGDDYESLSDGSNEFDEPRQ
ncbi:unnamed protein product [Microthlaspi erraticum]|uniref:Uncharacterized protein n=1 Tax=Microthlaspi erraticum TaxID=1685480 RepID=A0A6D2L191_9BRAS|nr:unnamed protein product [Microthlaspi erraticum]